MNLDGMSEPCAMRSAIAIIACVHCHAESIVAAASVATTLSSAVGAVYAAVFSSA